MIPARYRAAFERLLLPSAKLLVRTGVSPSFLTLTGLALVTASCLFLLVTGDILPFCGLVTASSLIDVLDGAVARAGGRVTKFGSYLDAICDRYSESVVVLSVAWVTGTWVLSTLVLIGALAVSYAKARAAMEVAISNREWPDLCERGERDGVYIAGLAASQLLPWQPLGRDLFWWTLVLLVVGTHATVVQRVLRARRLIRERSQAGLSRSRS